MQQSVALGVLTAMAVLAIFGLGTGRRVAGAALIVVSAIWIPISDRIMEGAVLLVLSPTHGVTVSDVLGVIGIAIGALVIWPLRSWRLGRSLAGRAALLLAVLALSFGVAASGASLGLPG